MKHTPLTLTATALLCAAPAMPAQAQTPTQTQPQPAIVYAPQRDEAAIRQLLNTYRDALKSGDPAAVSALFTANGVVMPPGAPTAVGQAALQATYAGIFSVVDLDLQFTVLEITVNGPYAFVRSTSDGTALIKARQSKVPEQNRELFVLEKVNGQWKIARYMFNKAS